MNFYNNDLSSKKYLNILTKYRKKISSDFLLKNTGSFIGDKALFKFLFCFELVRVTKNIKGDIIELGVWNGNNLISFKKFLDFFKIKKKIFGFDHFKGMPQNFKRNSFRGDKHFIKYIIKFFDLKNIQLIDDDIMNLRSYSKKFKKFSIIYIDCDLYETTKVILEELAQKVSKGGYIIFDEGNQKGKSGETKALKEFYRKNKKEFKIFYSKKGYQPDVFLKKR
tara:strand:- start:79 stop:747 length:669 start_codon:yes stop_codon:yes gene_type:complete